MSARLAQVVKDLPLDLPRPRLFEDPGVEALKQRLLRDHPELLAGDGATRPNNPRYRDTA